MSKLTIILELDKVRRLETMTKNLLGYWFLFIWSKHPLLNLIKVNILIKYTQLFLSIIISFPSIICFQNLSKEDYSLVKEGKW